MSEDNPTKPKRRRGTKRGTGTCAHASCTDRRAANQAHCSVMCRLLDNSLARGRRIAEALGPGTPASELYELAVEMAYTWHRYRTLDRELYESALSVGFTPETWVAMRDGTAA